MASLARRAVDAGFGAVIVAGGETSGAVVKELQYDAYEIGASVAPGVPVMTPVARPEFHLVLKSGNFGDEDFFQKALAATQNEPEATKEKKREAAAICKDLFTRGLVTGSSANLSFRLGESLYISASGASFGTITENEFVPVTLDGQWSGTRRPSKEYPLHLAVYQAHPQVQAVIHTHSIYSVLWSCLQPDGCLDCVPAYTPYLRMKVGKIGLVPYAPPGSDTLVSLFEQMVSASDGWLLANHGPIVAGKSLQDTLYALEELEQSCRVAWELQSHPAARCSES